MTLVHAQIAVLFAAGASRWRELRAVPDDKAVWPCQVPVLGMLPETEAAEPCALWRMAVIR